MALVSITLRLAAASVACAILAGASLPAGVRAIGAVPLLLYLPGRCWLAAFLPTKASGGEAQVLSVALSLALAVLLGVLLSGTGLLGQAGWMVGGLTLCLAACTVSLVTRRGSEMTVWTEVAPPVGVLRFGAVLLAGALAFFAFEEASRGALQQRPDLYTDFWIVPQDGAAPSLATAGLRNAEGIETTYAIDVVARGYVVDRGVPFALPDGAERTLSVALPSVAYAEIEPRSPWVMPDVSASALSKTDAERNRIELRLFKNGDRTAVYRRVWVALPAPVAPRPVTVASDAPAGTLSVTGSVVNSLRATAAVDPTGWSGTTPRGGATTGPDAVPGDATRPLVQSQVAAWKSPESADAAQPFRAAPMADVMLGLHAPRFTPSATMPADPTPLQAE